MNESARPSTEGKKRERKERREKRERDEMSVFEERSHSGIGGGRITAKS